MSWETAAARKWMWEAQRHIVGDVGMWWRAKGEDSLAALLREQRREGAREMRERDQAVFKSLLVHHDAMCSNIGVCDCPQALPDEPEEGRP